MRILASPAYSNRKANPYNALLYDAVRECGVNVDEYSHKRIILGQYDIVHYHWPDGYINVPSLPKTISRIAILLFSIFICRLKKTKIIWTVHNMAPHDAYYPRLSRNVLKFFARHCAGFIFLSKHSETRFLELYDFDPASVQTAVIPHGHYKDVYPPKVNKPAARSALGLPDSAPIILFFGMIKPYKNVGQLLKSFEDMGENAAHLLIAGSAEATQKAIVEDYAARNPRVHHYLKFISDEDLPYYMGAADLLVLPYKNILNSGVALLGLSYDLPVLAPALGSMKELQDDIGSEKVLIFEGDISANDLAASLAAIANTSGQIIDLSAYEWPLLGKKTAEFYTKICAI